MPNGLVRLRLSLFCLVYIFITGARAGDLHTNMFFNVFVCSRSRKRFGNTIEKYTSPWAIELSAHGSIVRVAESTKPATDNQQCADNIMLQSKRISRCESSQTTTILGPYLVVGCVIFNNSLNTHIHHKASQPSWNCTNKTLPAFCTHFTTSTN